MYFHENILINSKQAYEKTAKNASTNILDGWFVVLLIRSLLSTLGHCTRTRLIDDTERLNEWIDACWLVVATEIAFDI